MSALITGVKSLRDCRTRIRVFSTRAGRVNGLLLAVLLAALPMQAVAQTPGISISVNLSKSGVYHIMTEGDIATFTVSRIGNKSNALTVNYSISSGGGPADLAAEQAREGDYTSNIPTSYRFDAGSSAPHTFMVTALDGDDYEPNEYFTVTASGTYMDGDSDKSFSEKVIVRIKENDERYLTLSPVSDSVLMGVSHPEFKAKEGGTGNENQLKISLNEPLPYALDIRYNVGDDQYTTAASDNDFTMKSGTAQIPVASTSVTIDIGINEDKLVEPTEYFTLDFKTISYDDPGNALGTFNPVNFRKSEENPQPSEVNSQPLSVSIMDNDTPEMRGVVHLRGEGGGGITGFPSTRRTLVEGNSMTITAEIAGATPTSDIKIPLKFDHFPMGEAMSDDYSIPNSITIPVGQESGSVTLTITDDTDDERYRELLVVEIDDEESFPGGYTKGDRSKYEVIMLDNDKTPANLTGPTLTALTEDRNGTTMATFQLSIDRRPKADPTGDPPFTGADTKEVDAKLVLGYTGTASRGTDYRLNPDYDFMIGKSPAQPPNGCSLDGEAVTCTVTLTVRDDNLYEGGVGTKENVKIDLDTGNSSFTGGISKPNSLNLTIEDDELQPMFSIADVSGPEDGNLTFTVKREGASGNNVSVTAGTGSHSGATNSAIADTDYTTNSQKLDFGRGNITQTFEVAITDDNIDELDKETFAVTLSNPVDNQGLPKPAIADGSAIGTITDNDDPVSFSIANAEATEGGKVTFTVSRGGAEGNVASVKVATATDSGDGVKAADADDYTAITTAQTLNFAAEVTSQTVEVQTTQDDLFEDHETFRAVLSAPALGENDPGNGVSIESGKGTATGTIRNDDTEPSFAVADASTTEGDAITFTVTRTGAMDNVVSVKWNTKAATGAGAASASDYTEMTTATKLDFAKGEGSQTFTVATTEDVLHEGDETFLVELTEAVGGTISDAEATGTITNDDAAPTGITLSVDTNGSTAGTPSTVAEDAGATVVTVTATVNGATRYVDAKTVAVSVANGTAASPADYAAVSSFNITIAAGAASHTGSFTVTPVDDDLDEANETIDVTGTLTDITITGATVTFTDTDDPVSFSIADAEATEGGKITFTVSRGGAEDNVASVKVATAEDSGDGVKAADADDYTAIATAQTLNFAAGATSQTVEVQTAQDDLFEPDETFRAVLSDPALADGDPGTGVSIESDKGRATGTIKNDDTQPSFAVADASASEGDAITFTVTRSGAMDNAVSVKWNTKADTSDGANAASATDYTPATTATKLDFTKGEGSQTFTVATTEDTLNEANETFLVELTEPVGATIADAEATGTITNDDAAPTTLTLAVDADNATENVQTSLAENGGAKTVKVTATLGGSTQFDVDKTLTLIVGDDDDNATEGTDYTTVDDITLTIRAGDQDVEHTFTLTPTDDAFREDTETISFDATLTGVTVSGASITLTSDDAAPAITLTVDADKDTNNVQTSLAEDGGVKTVRVTATLDGTTRLEEAADLTLAVGKDGDSAEEGTDYTTIADRTITIGAGVASVTDDFTLTPTNDDLYEGSETISLDGTLDSVAVTDTSLTLTDDDAQPSFAVADASASEGNAITFTVTRTGAMDNVVSVKWNTKADTSDGANAASATDYTPATTATKLDFTKGEGSQTFTVATTEDVLHEGDETFLVELTEPVGATIADAEATGTITDDDAAPSGITLTVSPATVGEGAGETEITVTATVNGTTRYVDAKTVTVSVGGGTAISGTDYDAVANFDIAIAAGDASKAGTFDLTPTDDNLHEGSETIDVTGTSNAVTITKASITLEDNDAQPSFAVGDASASEGDAITFTVTRSGAMDNVVSVKWNTKADTSDGANAASATDYTPATTATKLDFTKGEGSQTFTVATTEDTLNEANETFLVELTEPVGATIADAEATGTITNDDAAPTTLTLAVDADNATENVQTSLAENGGAKTVKVTATLGGSTQFDVDKTLTLIVGDDDDNATEGTDYTTVDDITLTIPAGDQDVEHTFTLTPTDDAFREDTETISFDATLTGVTVSGASITLTSDDAAPAITLTVDADKDTNNVQTSLAEDGGVKTVRVTATLDGTTRLEEAADLTLAVGKDGDSAEEGTDYTTIADRTITIGAGVASVTDDFTLTPTNDDLYEGSETISLDGTLDSVAVTDTSLTLTDDDAQPSFAVADASASEGNAITFTVTRTGAMDNVVSVKWNTKADTSDGANAASATDYTPATTATKLDFTKGEGSQTFTVATTEDTLNEANETFLVELTEPVGATIADAEATGTITNDDAAPTTLTLAVDADNATENVQTSLAENGGAKTVKVTATLGGSTQFDVDKTLTLIVGDDDDNATEGTDYTTVDDITLTIRAGDQDVEHTFTLTPTDDAFREDTETISFDATLTGVTVSGASITLTSDDAAPAITLTVDADKDTNNVQTSLAEDGGVKTVRVTATLDGTTRLEEAADLTLAVGKDGDSAEEGTDYTTIADRTITIGAGVASVTDDFTLTPTNDDLYEGSETISLDGTLDSVAVTDTSLTLTDDDAQPSFAVADASASEGNAITFTVTRTGAMDNVVSVKWNTKADTSDGANAASATDYTPATTATKLDFTKGEGSQTFTVATTEDVLHEGDETFLVELTEPVGATIADAEATGTITDDDAAPSGITLTVSPATVGEGAGETEITVTATVNGTTRYVDAKTVTVSVGGGTAISGTDYDAVANFDIAIAAGDASKAGTFDLTPTDDNLHEGSETIDVTGTSNAVTITKASITLEDNDAQPSFAVGDASASEGDAITFTVTRSGAMDNVVSVKWNTKADTSDGANAASATDYTPATTATKLDFTKGEGSQTFTVATTEDTLNEANETFLVELTEPVGATIADAEATGTITNDDAAPTTLTLAVDADNATENVQTSLAENGGAKTVKVTATLGGSTQFDVDKTLTLIVGDDDDNATEGTDYTTVDDITLTIPAGDQDVEHTFTLTPTDDAFREDTETISFDATLTGVTVSGASITLTSDDAAPAITLTVDADKDTNNVQTSLAEDGGVKTVRVTATLDGTTRLEEAADLTLAVGKDGDSAEEGTDYTTIADRTITIGAGVASVTDDFTLTPTNDDLYEGSETISLDGTLDSVAVTDTSLTLTDDDAQPSFAVADASASEGNAITFTVTRTGAMDNVVSVKWNTKADTSDGANAASATDYTPATTATKLDFTKGEGSQTFTVATTEDVLHEGDETFLVELTDAVGGTISDAEATGTITDDDAAPSGITLTVSPATVGEGAGETEITVTATVNGTTRYVDAKTVTVSVADNTAVSPADYAAVSSFNITIAAGAASHTGSFTVTPVDDNLDESDETINVTGTLTDITITGATVTFTDNDDPVSFSIANAEATEGGKVTFTVNRAGAGDNVASVKVATAANSGDGVNAAGTSDYTVIATAQTLNFAKGVTSQTVEVQTTQDDLFEPDETFRAVLSDPALADGDPGTGVSIESGKGTATGTIKNDDAQPSFEVADASALEGDAITFTVTRSGAMDNVVSVKWNTKPDSGDGANVALTTDYTAVPTARTLTFAKSISSQTFTVATTEDNLHEGDETFLVELTEPVGGTITDAEATGTITNDDAAPTALALTVDADTVAVGTQTNIAEDGGAKTVRVTATLGGASTFTEAKTVTLEVGVTADSATESTDYTEVTTKSIMINAGSSSGYVEFLLTPTDDTLHEGSETISLDGTLTGLTVTDTSITLTDDDGPPTALTLSVDADTGTSNVQTSLTENGGAKTVRVTATLGGSSTFTEAKTVTLEVGADTDSATEGADYTEVETKSFTINAGASSGYVEFTLTPTDDTRHETSETISLDGTLGGVTVTDASLLLTDNDAAPTTLTLAVDADNATENVQTSLAENGGAKTVKVTATLGGSTQFDVDKTLTLIVGDDDDNATEGTDYTTVDDITLTIPAGDQDVEHTFTLTPTDDAFREDTETISFDATLTGVTVSGASITLTSDDAAPAITLTVDADKDTNNVQTSLAEDGGVKTVRVTATLDGTTRLEEAADLTLAVGKDGDSAEEGTDYTTVADRTISIGAGVASVTDDFTLTPTNDDLYEGTETISLDGTLTGVAVTDTSLTLTDDDAQPSFAVADASASEGDAITFTVTRTGAMDNAVSVKWNTKAATGDGAASATDYTEMTTATKLDFAKGVGTQTFTVATTEDVLHESDETFLVELTEPVGAIISDAQATGTITDDDAAPTGITLSVDTNGSTAGTPSTVAEDAGATVVTVTATVNGATRYVDAKTVAVSVADGTAASPADYAAVSSFNITIAAGAASHTGSFTVTPVDDDLDESNETIDVTGTLSGVTVTAATVTLTDTDDPVSFSIADAEATEGGKVTFTVNRAGAGDNVASVKVATAADSGDGVKAADTDDYTAIATTQTLNFAKGVTSQTVEVQTTQDDLFEPDETFQAVLSAPALGDGDPGTGVTIESGKGTAIGTIKNDDAQPSFAVADASASEGDAITFTVTRTGAMDNVVSVKWNTKADTSDGANAAADTDYTEMTTATKLDFAKGDDTQTFTVATTEDVLDEENETFLVELTGAVGGTITTAEATGTITDDDAAPSGITLTVAPTTVGEGAGETEITVTATVNGTTRYVDAKTVAVSVGGGSATSDTDYDAVANFDITIAAGDASKAGTFDLTPTDDALHEGSETIDVTGTSSALSITKAEITLTDNDGQPSFAVADASASEGDAITFTVTRTGAMDNAVSVKWNTKADTSDGANAASATDYTPATTATKLDFAKGVGTQTFTVATTEDTLNEANETFLVELTEAVGGTISDAEATGTITNDDAAPTTLTLAVDADNATENVQTSLAENGGAKTVKVTATLGGSTQFDVDKTLTLIVGDDDDSATEGTDYTTVDDITLTIRAGDQDVEHTFTLTPTDDAFREDSETISFDATLTSVTVSGASITLTSDDAAPAITLTVDADKDTDNVQTSLAEDGGVKTVRVTATLDGTTRLEEAADLTLAVGKDGDSAEEGTDYTTVADRTISIGAGVASVTDDFTLTPTNDDLYEGTETISLDGTLTGVAVTDTSLTLTDDDAQPSFAVADASASEGDAITFTVTRTGAMDNAVSVKWNTKAATGDGAASATDYTEMTTATKLDFAKGVGTQTFTVATTEDVLHESDETFLVELTEPVGGTISDAEATGTITDDDAAPSGITLTVSPATVGEGAGETEITVTATVSGTTRYPDAQTVTISVGGGSATSDTDYDAVANFDITIAAGDASKAGTFDLTPTDDALHEGSETIDVTGTSGALSITKAEITLTDNDGQPSFAVADASASEGDAITFTVTRTGAMDNAVSVKWNTKADTSDGANAASATDYTPATTATKLDFAKGVGTQTFTVATTEDTLNEANETFLVELTEAVGGTISDAEATGTITNDDAAPTTLTLAVDADNATENVQTSLAENGGAKTVKVTATLGGSTQFDVDKTLTLIVGDDDDSATEGTDYTTVDDITLTIRAGDQDVEHTFTLTPTDDAFREDSETISFDATLTSVTVSGASITLTSDDAAPAITLTVDADKDTDNVQTSLAEDGGVKTVRVTATLDGTTRLEEAADLTLAVGKDGDSAEEGTDYTTVADRTISIGAGVASVTDDFTLTPTNDDLYEGTETISLDGTLTGVAVTDTSLTLTDDDAQPSFAVADASASEGDAITFTVTRTGAMDNAVSVKWNTKAATGDGAASATDYTEMTTATKLDFAKGVGTQTFTVATTEDVLHESDETFLVELTEPVGGTISDAEATGTITDDDAAPSGITLTVSPATVGEGAGETEITVTATVSGTTRYPDAQTVTISVGGGTAISDTDYDAVANFDITIAAGDASKAGTFDLTPTDDALHEGSETIDVTGTSGALSITKAEITLTDNDGQPSFAVADASASEGDAITFTVTRTGAMDNAVSVKWNTKADTSDGANAASATDYTPATTATKLDFAKGVGTQTFTVATTEDVLHESDETFLVELTEPVGGTISDAEATGTITDDDAAPSGITLTVSPATVGEGAGETEITVTATVSGTTRYPDAQTVTISVGGGTAISDTDYDAVANFDITIAAGDASKAGTFDLTPTDDALHEGSETIDVTGTSGALSITKAEITLTDNDGQPSFAVADASASEGDAITFTVTRTGAMDNAVSVKWNTKADTSDGANAASATDYTPATTATKLDFAKGVGTQTFTVATTEDTLNEANETFLVELTEAVGGTISDAEATGTITNDDAAPSGITLTVSPTTVGEENGKSKITVTATVNGETRYVDAKTVTVSVGGGSATSDTDYHAVANFDITIAAGDSSKAGTFDLTPTEDFLDEINETINVTGASGSLTITPATVTITDATEPPTATLVLTPTTINESGATNSSTVTATLSGESSAAVTLTVDAVANANTEASDFTVSTNKTLTIAAGATTSTGAVTITAVDNNVDAPDKSVTVSATTSGGGVSDPTDQTLTITDDEATPTVTLVLTPTAIDESGDDNASTVTATLSSESSAAVTVTVSVPNDAPVTLSNNKTLTIAAGATTSTGTVTITAVDNEVDAPDKTVTVSATASGRSVADPANQTLSINDDEGVPTATLVLTPGTINETGATNSSTVTATLSGKSSAAVTLMVAAVAGANTAASDFTVSANKTLTIAAGATTSTGAVTITAVDNNVDAPDKSVTVSATTSGGGVSDPTDQTLTITDDEATPTVTLVLTPATINESGATNASTVTATLSGESSAAVTVEVSVPNTAPVTLSSNTILSIAAGAKTSTGTVTITAVDNNVDAPNETVTVSAAAIGGVAIPVIETLTINDDDVAPTGITLTVSPATIRETDGETEITVTATVNGTTRYADAKTVTVSVGDGTATSGMDYDAVSNFDIIIAAGDTSNTGTFDLMLINDAVQEKDETIEITGSSGALNITKAMITITNSDPMPAAWLGRFGRTVAEQALDGIAGRIAASRSAGVQGSIAGHALNFNSPYSGSEALPRLDPRAGAGGTGVESSTTNDTTTLNNLVNNNVQERSELTLTSGDSGIDAFDTDGQTSRSYTMTARELLLGSSFTATGEKDVSGGSLASWGRTAQSSFDGREGTLSLDGEATTTMLGVDYARDHWLVGMALMQSNGKGGYQDSETELRAASPACSTTENGTEQGTCNGAVRDGEGEVEATLTAVTPYAAIQTSENLKLWGTLGHGTGEVTLTPAVGDPLKADISWTMAAVGLRSDIIVPRKNSTELGPLSDSGLALALTADALWARTSSNRTQDMVASDSDVTRLRFGLEGSYQITLKQGGSVTPRLELGVRQDGGSAETGLGIELVGGLSWLDPTLGLSIDLSGRTLIVHSSDDLKNQSFAVAFAWDPDPATQRGPSLKFSQQWGTIALGGLDTPFGPDSIEDLGDSENTARWQADAAWGFPIFGGSFTGSPHVGVGLASDTRDYSLGWRLTPAANANAPDLSFAVKATRQESDTAPPEHSIGFVLIFRW